MRQNVDAKETKLLSTNYTIQMASKLSGVGVHTIRAWEKRYKALVPERDVSGHRTYSKSDVEKLMLLSELCLLGYSISKVANLNIPELKDLLKDLGKSAESLENTDFNLVNESKMTIDPSQSLPILNFALKSYKLDIISLELGKLTSLLSPREFALEILLPLASSLVEVQESGAYNQHQAEVLRSLLKFHMGYNLYHPNLNKEKKSVKVIISGMHGDLNDLGIGVVGLLCNHYGFHYAYLGADMSYDAIADAASGLSADVVIIGPTNAYAQMGKAHFQNYIEKLSFKLNSSVELVVAGKSELDLGDIPFKRLQVLKTFDAIDDYLSKKIY